MKCKTKYRGCVEKKHGAAVVEFAILTLLLVPLVLVPMYFQDAWRYKLDAQEAVSSAAWDYAYQDYQGGQIKDPADYNKKIYKNLWSGNDKDKKDPAGPWADFKWEQKISCNVGQKNFGACYSDLGNKFHNNYTKKGSLASCKGQISVANYFIPRFFLQDFSGTDHFIEKKKDLRYKEYKFGFMVDTWALNTTGVSSFKDRSNVAWKHENDFISQWKDFTNKAEDGDGPEDDPALAKSGGYFDDPTKLQLKVNHNAPFGHTIPYEDDNETEHYKDTYDNRTENCDQGYYLGCPDFRPNC